MSRYSQGVLARKLVNSPCRLGLVGSPRPRSLRRPLAGLQAAVAAVLDHDLEAARRAQAFDRRGPEDVDQPVLDLFLEAPSAAVPRGPSPRQLAARCDHGSRRASRTWPRSSGALAFSRIDCPAMATVCLTPVVVPWAMASMCCMTRCVRSTEAASGKLHVDQQIALVLRRDEAGRRVR